MKTPHLPVILVLLGFFGVSGITGGPPATVPAAPSAGNDDRFNFLALQLSSVEESIKAVTAGMKAAGYKANVAADKVEGFQKGNELMDRKGGAPVPWDKFYGKNAGSFHTWWNDPIKRPKQFDSIYKANNDQAAKAREEVASMGKKVDVMLARRRSLEAEQNVLWATISLEEIQDLEISFRPIYRLKLKAAATQPAVSEAVSDSRVGMLRALVLFERTADRAAGHAAESVGKDQGRAFTALKETIRVAQAALQESVFRATQADELNAADSQQTKEAMALARHMAAICKNVTEAYKLALEGDAAQDEPRKLTFRAQLQESLPAFADSTAEMDAAIKKLSTVWNIKGEVGVDSTDKLPADSVTSIPATNPPPGTVATSAGPKPNVFGPEKAPNAKPDGATDSRVLEVQRFTGHNKAAKAVIFTPDGRSLISGGTDHTIRMWDISTAREIKRFNGHTGALSRLSISADGKIFASGSRDHTARVWNVATGEQIASFKHGREIETVALSTDGRLLIVGDFGGHPALYDVSTAQKIAAFGGNHQGGYASAFSIAGRYAATGGEESVIHVWDLRTPMRHLFELKQAGGIHAMAFTPEEAELIGGGGSLSKGSSEYAAYLWDMATGKEILRFEGHTGELRAVGVSPSGHICLTASMDGTVRLWDIATGKQLINFNAAGGPVWGATFSPDGHFAASATDDGIVRLWKLPDPT